MEKQHGGKLIKLQEEIERQLSGLNYRLKPIEYQATLHGNNAELVVRISGPRAKYTDKIVFQCPQGGISVEAKAFSQGGDIPLNSIAIAGIEPGWVQKVLENGLNVILMALGETLPK